MVYGGDVITRARELLDRNDEPRVALLNMANARVPGGGFLAGARAQEEQLCHRSDLFAQLKLTKNFNPGHGEYIPERAALVTRGVRLLRAGAEDAFEPLEPVSVDVVSAAARHYGSVQEALADASMHDHLVATWKAVLAGVCAAGSTVALLSALGCGAFNNPPREVGRALREALDSCVVGPFLKEVHVVIKEDHNSNGNNLRDFATGLGRPVDEQRAAP